MAVWFFANSSPCRRAFGPTLEWGRRFPSLTARFVAALLTRWSGTCYGSASLRLRSPPRSRKPLPRFARPPPFSTAAICCLFLTQCSPKSTELTDNSTVIHSFRKGSILSARPVLNVAYGYSIPWLFGHCFRAVNEAILAE